MADISKVTVLSGDTYNLKDEKAREDISAKADKEDTVLTTTLSRGRSGNAGTGSLSFGNSNVASGSFSQGFGSTTTANGDYSTSKGFNTIAENRSQSVSGEYNVPDPSTLGRTSRGTYVEIVGNGTGTGANRSNARVLDWEGNERLKGDLYVGCNSDSTGGTKVATINDIPSDAVSDVQINGTSILQNSVANIPKASDSTLGVVKGKYYGIKINADGDMYISPASESELKAGASNYLPIVPSNQHKSAFYALAKLVGADMAQSPNPVGTYTDEALAGIQRMLGIIAMLAQDEPDLTADHAYAIGAPFCFNGKLYKATSAIAVNDTITPTVNCEQLTFADLFVKKTDYATSTNAGIAKVNNAYGIGMTANSELYVQKATDDQVKFGVISQRPIVPEKQHQSVFYGLSKLAGVDLASSDTPVGTYTAEAKSAILAMLGAVGKTDYAASATAGVVKVTGTRGIYISADGDIRVDKASSAGVKSGTSDYNPVVPQTQHEAVFFGLAKVANADMSAIPSTTVGQYPQAQKTAIQTMLGIEADVPLVEEVSGANPSIVGMPNVRYVCGTVSTLTLTPPASGSMVVRFSSGSTATILTVPNTVKFPVWFDYTALETNTTYEIIITDEVYGGVMSWAD